MRREPSDEARAVARAAARWLVLLESGAASAEDHARLRDWRASNSRHENAWQKAQQLRQRFTELPAPLAMATLDRPEPSRRALLKHTLGVAALLPAAWWAGRQLPLDAWSADLHTATGERRRSILANGSILQLNTDSAVDIDLHTRQLTLIRGEMALKVPGDLPLSVLTPYGRLSVSHGEASLRLAERDCRMRVLAGTAQLWPLHGAELRLRAGQQVSLWAAGAGPLVTFDASLPDWREGVLMAQDQPLGDFLRELSRHRPGLLRWDPALEALRVTGSFRLDDTDRVLALLAASLPLEVHARTRYWVTLVPRRNIG
ncbi:TPA: DUF4880 domain-containing protein [Pseudomonas aeruginosa]|nr:DUF4880 domain-containing protein [Pseudomonas aeruginosa]